MAQSGGRRKSLCDKALIMVFGQCTQASSGILAIVYICCPISVTVS